MLQNRLKNNTLVLDGGLATELERKGFSLLHDPLWSARFLLTNPEEICSIHKSYLQNGADIITTASYQASLKGFEDHFNLTDVTARSLIKESVMLALKAKKDYCTNSGKAENEIFVAGSVGPYGAALADGSEYSGNYCDSMSHEDLVSWHRPRVECLLEAGVDVLAFETIPAIREAEALLMLLAEFPDAKAWLSFSCGSKHETNHREALSSFLTSYQRYAKPDQLVAVGVNCCPPEFVTDLLESLSNCDLPLIAYPNSGEMWDSKSGWNGVRSKPLLEYVETWLQRPSVKIIGGCCRTTPEDISQIRDLVLKRS